ncbi:MAG: ABC transporter permease [Cyclobacteriaceae bacterium]|nr:ABC transporter permease [Cyclobacteriaceae bacterium]
MFKNYLITAYRNLLRKRSSTFFNIAGLTLGITGSIVLFLLLHNMLTFDKFQSKYDRIYRVVSESDNNGEKFYTPGIPTVLTPAFKTDFPEAEEVAFTTYTQDGLILIPQRTGEPKKYYEEDGIAFTEQSFFRIFDWKPLHGDLTAAIKNPNEAVLAKSIAVKYFGRENAIGEIFNFDDVDYKVTAIVDDPPGNTDFPFTIILSYETVRKSYEEQDWGSTSSNNHNYFLLKEGVDISTLEARMADFTNKHIGKDNYDHRIFNIQPLSTVHYDTRYHGYSYNVTSKGEILTVSLIAVFLILTGCINFINLSTAESIKRSKEVGIRKSLGSSRSQLVLQFLGETSIVTLVSILLALVLSQLVLSYLNPFMDLDLNIDLMNNSAMIIFLVIIFVSVSLLSGVYPAFIMSAFKPAMVMKASSGSNSAGGFFMRRGLVVFQFVISQLLIIGTIVIIQQMNYLKTKDMGYNKDAIIVMSIPEQETFAKNQELKSSKMRTLKNEIIRQAGVEHASLSNTPPSSGNVNGTSFIMEGESDEQRKDTQVKTVDGDYITLFGLKLLAGRNLNDYDTATEYVVNRQFANIAGYDNPQDIIGKRVKIWGHLCPIAGVVEDFHTTSLHQKIEPTVLFNRLSNYRTLSIKVNPNNYQASIEAAKKLWEQAYPKHIFEYTFLDERIREFYESEGKMSVIIGAFTTIAIVIGCIGLFGLATFMANQRIKEIGVRKVLGASVQGIVFSFSKEFIVLIVIAFVFAAPLGWLAMRSWLQEFEYRIDVGPVIFATALVTTLIIALITVGYRSFQAATANPVNSLRNE